MNTPFEMFLRASRAYPEHAAIVSGENALTYAQLESQVAYCAALLHASGARAGSPIAILFPNGPLFAIAYLAAWAVGAIPVPLSEQSPPTELASIIADSQIAHLVTSLEFRDQCDRLRVPVPIFLAENGMQAFERQLDTSLHMAPDARAMVQFSSGSTGRPKRIARTHRNLAYELEQLIPTLGATRADRFIGVAPFSHVNGLVRSMLASLCAGATLYPIRKFERHTVAELIERERITLFIGVPFMFSALAQTNYGRTPDFSSLRYSISASAPMPQKFNALYREKFGSFVRQLYGSTETGTMSINLNPDIERTLESVGKPIPGVSFRLLADTGGNVPEGEVGEIAVTSPAAITRYDGLEGLNREVFRDGYFLTGDLGRMERDGTLYIVGRKSLFINKGGYKIDPRQVEQVLEMHPSVEEAAVIGVPTVFGDEQVKALVVLRAPCLESELVQFCRDKLSAFKIPSVIEFRKELPKSASGKILRKSLT